MQVFQKKSYINHYHHTSTVVVSSAASAAITATPATISAITIPITTVAGEFYSNSAKIKGLTLIRTNYVNWHICWEDGKKF